MKIKVTMTIISLIYLFIVVSACKKTQIIQTSIIGKWKLDSLQLSGYINNQPTFQTVYRPTNDYYDFRADSVLQIYVNQIYDTRKYSIVSENGNQLIRYSRASSDTIKALTSNSLIFTNPQGLYSKYFFTK